MYFHVLWDSIRMKHMAHPCVVGTLDQAVGIQGLAFASSRWSRSQSRWSIMLCPCFFCFFVRYFINLPMFTGFGLYWQYYHMFVLVLKASSPLFLVGGNPRICCFKRFEHSLCWSRSPVIVELSFFFVCSSLSSFARKIPVATIKYDQRKSTH